MKFRLSLLAVAGLALCSAVPVAAAPQASAVVEAVQMPAWVERGTGANVPLAPGMELQAGERVRTGAQSRVLLKLSEGSHVKLGENATFRLDQIGLESGGVFRAALSVLEGAFRFTTEKLTHNRRRNISVSVATVTAGIRGTDLWGKSGRDDRQVVCLIEGSIEVGAAGEKAVVMDQPRQFYQRNQGRTEPVGFVEADMLAKWALETEIAPGRGAARAGGKWKLTLASVETQAAALEIYDRLRAGGYPARIHPRQTGGKFVYEVRITSLPSKSEAEALAAQLKGMPGVAEGRVSM